MKKSVLALAMAFGVTSAFAQDLTSKKGEPILPEKGDWAISADATPFLGYLGKIGSGSNAAPTFNFLANHSIIMGKYFLDEKTAIRAGLNIGFNSQTVKNLVNTDNQTAPTLGNDYTKVTDKATFGTTGIGLTGGIEKRKGKTRLQGYYGAEAGFYIFSQKQTNSYGNAFGSKGTSNQPVSTTFSSGDSSIAHGSKPYVIPDAAGSTAGDPVTGSRVTSEKLGTTFQFGVRGFIGVEFFILPKMSLGGEFGWGVGFSNTSGGSVTKETLNAAGTGGISTVYKTAGSSNFVLGTDNKNSMFGPAGSIRMNFYF